MSLTPLKVCHVGAHLWFGVTGPGQEPQYNHLVYFAKGEPRNVSTVRFFDGYAIYGCSGLGNCRMLIFLSGAFFLIGLICMLIRWNHLITYIFRFKLHRDFVLVSIPTFTTVRISNKIVKNSHRPPRIENQHGRHIWSKSKNRHNFPICQDRDLI